MITSDSPTRRDVAQSELISTSRRVRRQLSELVRELEQHVCALRAEISHLQTSLDKGEEPPDA